MAVDAPCSVNSLLEAGERLVMVGWAYGSPGGPSGTADAGAWLFAASCRDPEAALEACRDAWLDEMRAERTAGVDHDFGAAPNWGDFTLAVSAELLAAHGLRRIEMSPALHLHVDHDEALAM